MPAALVSHIIRQLLAPEQPTRMRLKMAVTDGLQALYKMYPDSQAEWKSFLNLMNQAMELAANSNKDIDNISIIGEGWVGDEALAIAVYCALRHFDDFRKALAAAVSHGGDSDSTGAVTGNILGAAIGYEAIPEDFKRDLEMHDLILHMADDLYRGEISKME
jgi:ADP-ribosylglycohydrolase